VKCPRCEGPVLDERERSGIVVDVCPDCRGIWLDRGELEKLLTQSRRESEEYDRWRESQPPPRRSEYRDRDDDYDDEDRRHGRKKRGLLHVLSDIFD